MAEYIVGDIYCDDGTPNWFQVPSLDDLNDEYERIVRCRDCKHFAPIGYKSLGTNKTTKPSCLLLSRWDSEYDFMEWWFTKPDGFCVWGERRPDE